MTGPLEWWLPLMRLEDQLITQQTESVNQEVQDALNEMTGPKEWWLRLMQLEDQLITQQTESVNQEVQDALNDLRT